MAADDRLLYLDYNATTPPDPRVVERMNHALEAVWGNPSSTHGPGLAARDLVQQAREDVAALLGAEPARVVFTSGGTESNRLALWSAWHGRPAGRDRIVVSAVEHPSVLEAARGLAAFGAEVVTCPVDAGGAVKVEKLAALCADRTALIAVMLANNEVGTVQPVAAVTAVARQAGARVLCDAIQAAGKLPVHFGELGVDYLTASAHKIYGPKGAACLCVAPGAPLRSVLRASGQEGGVRPGTENVPGIAGFGEACRIGRERLAEDAARLARLRDRLAARLAGEGNAVVLGGAATRLPNTLGLLIPGVEARALLVRLSRRAVAVSAGSACHARSVEPSHVVRAMGISHDRALGFVRLSLGRPTTGAEVEEAADLILEEAACLRSSSRRPRRSASAD
jgi:cysteine desulfurase